MFDSINQDIKNYFKSGNMIDKIIIVNVLVFLAITLIKIFFLIFELGSFKSTFIGFFALHSNIIEDLLKPWVFITHMFVHEGLFHILFNMLWLYLFGRIVGDLLGNKRILPLYILTGLGSAIVFILSMSFLYSGQDITAIGASGAVLGLAVVAAALNPEMSIRLFLLGNVRLKYLVLGLVILDLVFLSNGSNTGGRFGHLGGALTGGIYMFLLRNKQVDMTNPIINILDSLTNFYNSFFDDADIKKNRKIKKSNPSRKKNGGRRSNIDKNLSHQEQLDLILEKIKKSGYDSLTKEEKEFLFQASKK